MTPAGDDKFPPYKPGQYIALRRDDCRLTTRKIDGTGRVHFVPVLDEKGRQKRGAVTHSYSIASAPYQTEHESFLEFYIVLEVSEHDTLGRLTESIFSLDPRDGSTIEYAGKIVGNFTFDKIAGDATNVLLIGSGTGLAPFASMIKQLDFDASEGHVPDCRVSLIHGNRTQEELAYDRELREIESRGRFDFVYIPTISRPDGPESRNDELGTGRANNMFRHLMAMPLKEQEDLDRATSSCKDVGIYKKLLERTTPVRLPGHLSINHIRGRLSATATVVATCGNPGGMTDIQTVAEAKGMRFEKEDWKPPSK